MHSRPGCDLFPPFIANPRFSYLCGQSEVCICCDVFRHILYGICVYPVAILGKSSASGSNLLRQITNGLSLKKQKKVVKQKTAARKRNLGLVDGITKMLFFVGLC